MSYSTKEFKLENSYTEGKNLKFYNNQVLN